MKRIAAGALIATCLMIVGAAATSTLIPDIAGVYKHRFENHYVDGEGGAYQSEDSLEIAQVDDTHAYFSVHLDFLNGHECNIAGVARLEADRLVYTPHLEPGDYACTLALAHEDDAVVLHDIDSGCLITFCGMRGSFEGAAFPLSWRQRIRYMWRLRMSQGYRAALREAGLR
ncbi:MAG: hypothetical protein ABUS57_12045 [Pseudomonadota bacterium]